MQEKITNERLQLFRNQINSLVEKELGLQKEMRYLYKQLELECNDDEVLLRHVRQIYFNIQKERLSKIIQEKLEFHPFFGYENNNG